jgi:hypothetical protein
VNESPQLTGVCVDMLIWTTEGADIPLEVILTLSIFFTISSKKPDYIFSGCLKNRWETYKGEGQAGTHWGGLSVWFPSCGLIFLGRGGHMAGSSLRMLITVFLNCLQAFLWNNCQFSKQSSQDTELWGLVQNSKCVFKM